MLNTSKSSHHIGAIASLILISLLSSWSGLSPHHDISNCWDGFLWGIADPVLRFDSLVSLVAIGLVSARVVYGSLIATSFLSAAVLGVVIALSNFSLPGVEVAIAVSSIGFGVMLAMPSSPNWIIVAILSAIAGIFPGYFYTQSIVDMGITSQLAYILGMVLSQYAVLTSVRQVGNTINSETIQDSWFNTFRFVGLVVFGIGFVFCGNLINWYYSSLN